MPVYFKNCHECGYKYETAAELRTIYLGEAPYGCWNWRWWRIRLTPAHRLLGLITFCPRCLHDWAPV